MASNTHISWNSLPWFPNAYRRNRHSRQSTDSTDWHLKPPQGRPRRSRATSPSSITHPLPAAAGPLMVQGTCPEPTCFQPIWPQVPSPPSPSWGSQMLNKALPHHPPRPNSNQLLSLMQVVSLPTKLGLPALVPQCA